MAAWGCGNLENDDALAWLRHVIRRGRAEQARVFLRWASDPVIWLDATDACIALAAAELVAAAVGRPHPLMPDFCDAGPLAVDGELRSVALDALRNVREASELAELWEEVGADGWHAEVADLERRLSQDG